MIDRAEVERAAEFFRAPDGSFERLLRRRDRKRRNQRIGAGALAIIIALVSFVAMTRAFRTSERPAIEPTPPPKPSGIFSEVGGWIVYGQLGEKCEPTPCTNPYGGIRAVDPTRPDHSGRQIQLSTDRGTPLAWSSDGSKLLILRNRNVPHQAFASNLFVLNADGTETRLTEGVAWIAGGSFSPDGSKVVYGTYGVHKPPGIFVVDAGGGTPPLLLTGGDLLAPTFSPDGSKIAYFAWDGQRYRLQVMNADGTGSRALGHDVSFEDMGGDPVLFWSPDGTRLAIGYGLDIYTVKADGSDLTLVIRNGRNPNWSPDGSRIAYDFVDVSYPPGPYLEIADADGKNPQVFSTARSGPWNPLVQPDPELAEVPAASEGVGLTWTLVVALLILVAGSLVTRRRTGRNAGTEI